MTTIPFWILFAFLTAAHPSYSATITSNTLIMNPLLEPILSPTEGNLMTRTEYLAIRNMVPNLGGTSGLFSSSSNFSITEDENAKRIYLTFHVDDTYRKILFNENLVPSVDIGVNVHAPLNELWVGIRGQGLDAKLEKARAKYPTYPIFISGIGISGALALLHGIWLRVKELGFSAPENCSLLDLHIIAFSPSCVGDQAFADLVSRISTVSPLIIYIREGDLFYNMPTGLKIAAGDTHYAINCSDLIVPFNPDLSKTLSQKIVGVVTLMFNYLSFVGIYIRDFAVDLYVKIKGLFGFGKDSESNPGRQVQDQNIISTVQKYAWLLRIVNEERVWVPWSESLQNRTAQQLGRYGKAFIVNVVRNETMQATSVIMVDTEARVLVVGFQGTDCMKNWLEDFDCSTVSWKKYGDNIKIHRGFMDTYQSIEAPLFSEIKGAFQTYNIDETWKLTFCGHSLGASIAMLAAFDYFHIRSTIGEKLPAVFLITYGQPKTGNLDFVKLFASFFDSKEKYLRIVNNLDNIPHLVPSATGLIHGGYQIWISPYASMLEYPDLDWRVTPGNPKAGSDNAIDTVMIDHYFVFDVGISGRSYFFNIAGYQYWGVNHADYSF